MPQRFVDSYLPYLLMQAASRMSLTFQEALKSRGVRESEWRVLATLSNSSGMRLGEVERHVLIVQSTLSRTIDRLKARGWVESRKDPNDRRALQLALTKDGQSLADELISAAQRLQNEDLAHLATGQRDALINMLSSLFPALGFAGADIDSGDAPFRMKVRVK